MNEMVIRAEAEEERIRHGPGSRSDLAAYREHTEWCRAQRDAYAKGRRAAERKQYFADLAQAIKAMHHYDELGPEVIHSLNIKPPAGPVSCLSGQSLHIHPRVVLGVSAEFMEMRSAADWEALPKGKSALQWKSKELPTFVSIPLPP